jgi:hypothetical protein
MKDIFKNEEFEALFSKVQNDVKEYIEVNNIELEDELSVENLIMWQMTPSGHYFVHPTEKCPENLKAVVVNIITKHNPTL